MSAPDRQVIEGILALLDEARGEWEHTGEIGPQTRFVADLGLESLEIVVLATMIQQRYGRLPFPRFFDEIGRRAEEERDMTVTELAKFVCENRQATRVEV